MCKQAEDGMPAPEVADFKFVGTGTIYSIGGVIQPGLAKYHFYERKAKGHLGA